MYSCRPNDAVMTPIVLIGGGGHAKVVSAVLGKLRQYQIVGYTALVAGPVPPDFSLYLGDDNVLADLVASGRVVGAVIGIGIVDVGASRSALCERLLALGLALPSIVSPMSVINTDVVIGDGTVVMDGVVVNPGARIGECSIINTNATVEHDCTVGACSHIGPGVVLCGGVSVGARSIIGAGACVLPGVRIGERCLVGAGATVTRHLSEPGVYVGNPAVRVEK
jgi:sugar O-acyltransferase (sialic acid O-acetyltransferase NeuD family)